MANNNYNIEGLTDEQVIEARAKFGHNALEYKKDNGFIDALKSLAKEPMVVLLLAASIIYFISGKTGDGIFCPVLLCWLLLFLFTKIQEVETP